MFIGFLKIHEFSGKIPRTSRTGMNNVTATIVPILVLVETFACLEFLLGIYSPF
jgi:hypothetical protein